MKNKKGDGTTILWILWVLFIIFSIILIIIAQIIIQSNNNLKNSTRTNTSNNTNNLQKLSNAISSQEEICIPENDNYILPDFQKMQTFLSQQSIIKDIPKNGKINLQFFHFSGKCRVWDKKYLLSKEKIEEKDTIADIDIWIHSDYVNKIQESNLCEVIAEAREKGDIGQFSTISTARLIWNYKSLLKYKECLGLKI